MNIDVSPETHKTAVEAVARFLFEHSKRSEEASFDEYADRHQDEFRDRAAALLDGVTAVIGPDGTDW